MSVEEITRLFVGTHTKIDIAMKRFGTIIEGQRGTGKSMILKYLSFPVQMRSWQNSNYGPLEYFQQRGFIGVYFKLQQGVFDKQDLQDIEDIVKRAHIFEHRLTAALCVSILETMKEVAASLGRSLESGDELSRIVNRIIDAPHEWLQSPANIVAVLDVYRDALRREARLVDEFLRNPSDISFFPKLSLTGTMYDLLELFQEYFGLKGSCFFLLLDDFDVLHDWQQQILLGVAAQRKFDLVCFKFGIMSEGLKTRLAGSQRTFRPGDDFDPITLDMVERGMLRNDYPVAVKLIAAKRLKESGWDRVFGQTLPELNEKVGAVKDVINATNNLLNNLFPLWVHGGKIKDEIREAMEAEWDRAEKKPTKKRNDYFSKYGNARYFRSLRGKKQRERYAGFEYMVLISSGIVRQFLEICSLAIGEAYKDGWSPQKADSITAETQDRAIRDYSESFFQNLNKGGGAHVSLDLGQSITSQIITDLIEALSDLFYERLHYPGHGEPEILAFALKDSNPFVDELLRVCVRESVFQKFRYAPKTPGEGRLMTYILNRRLVPRRDLSALRMQGRIEMNANDLSLAISNRQRFIKRFMPTGYQPAQPEML